MLHRPVTIVQTLQPNGLMNLTSGNRNGTYSICRIGLRQLSSNRSVAQPVRRWHAIHQWTGCTTCLVNCTACSRGLQTLTCVQHVPLAARPQPYISTFCDVVLLPKDFFYAISCSHGRVWLSKVTTEQFCLSNLVGSNLGLLLLATLEFVRRRTDKYKPIVIFSLDPAGIINTAGMTRLKTTDGPISRCKVIVEYRSNTTLKIMSTYVQGIPAKSASERSERVSTTFHWFEVMLIVSSSSAAIIVMLIWTKQKGVWQNTASASL